MTGAGGLSSSPQPVTENRSTLSLSGALRGPPAEGGGGDQRLPPQGKAFPSRLNIRKDVSQDLSRL